MKRVYKTPETPEGLKRYSLRFPHETWERFRRFTRRGYREVKQQLLQDQHGLCAYCEISIMLADDEESVDDFRVEHFYPKGETNFKQHNYHLDWQNLLGVCHGGSQPNVEDPEWRFSSRRIDRSCDVLKGGKLISGRILNPLQIPAEVRLFRYNEHDGRMIVDEATCPKELRKRAKNTIRELNLNAPRLMRMRLEVIRFLQDEVEAGLSCGEPFENILPLLAEHLLQPNEQGNYAPFFTLLRWYLGSEAETFLAKNHYNI